ncbi:restriction endonuclease, SacI family [Pseudomonas sp. Y39-6]|uniref:restriction endonuclease, SacI family n=1 Tax=Pseudomonas sp. Y39-6 TaxID=2749807 RepID=UPI0019103957|nr:restriction endonuclease, SacI family [Pseudomonas sp. Y39-6]URS60022.1 restriction endonuclease, SacI family [Pseudomonas sp. Y39-6]
MAISNSNAELILRAEASSATGPNACNNGWLIKIEELSRLCEVGGSATHIAFLGTSILAKASSDTVDLFAIMNRPGLSRHSQGSLRNAFQTLPVTADC